MDQRRNQRFELALPLRVMAPGNSEVSHDTLTRNISARGVLFTTESQVPLGGPIEYVVTLTNVDGVEVDLRCSGKVVRTEKTAPENEGYLIAATLDRYQFVRRD